MNHWIVAPVVIPLLAGGMLLAMRGRNVVWKRMVSGLACGAELYAAIRLASAAAGGQTLVYAVGGWPPPFGIVLVGTDWPP